MKTTYERIADQICNHGSRLNELPQLTKPRSAMKCQAKVCHLAYFFEKSISLP